MRQELDCKANGILFESDGLQVGLDSAASQISGVRNSLTESASEGLQQDPGRSATNQSWLKSLLLSVLSRFLDRGACLVNAETAAQGVRISNLLASVFHSLELDLRFNMELLGPGEQEGGVSSGNPDTSKTHYSMLVVSFNY